MKKWIRNILPNASKVRDHPHLQFLGSRIRNPNLWHINRHAVSKAVSIGLFMAWIPMPFQMVPAALLAFFFRANMVISVALVWVTNPLTMPPIFYFSYKIGAMVLHMPLKKIQFEISWEWLWYNFSSIAVPLYVGSIICGILLALIGNLAVRVVWRLAIYRSMKRHEKKKKSK